MKKIVYDGQFFNIKDTLTCGQVFRFLPFKNGYLIKTMDRCAYVYQDNQNAVIEGDEKDEKYFYNYFDLDRDYNKIYTDCHNENVDILTISANAGKGIRILNQDKNETAFSFIISQNNNIPRIKSTIEKLCLGLGDKKTFMGEEYYAFPSYEKIANATLEFLREIGLGYRAEYIKCFAESIVNGLSLESLSGLSTPDLKKNLISMHGIGPKVADCITLFAFHRSDSFPVDTWIEKVYREDLKGTLKDRGKISDELVKKFGENAGYYQQYLFYYKRSIENK